MLNNGNLGANQKVPEPFRCPLVPLLPCLGIYCNFILCTVGNGQAEWTMFIVFEILGMFFYMFYGYKNSEMPKRM